MVYGTYNYTVVTGAYKPTDNWGASHCRTAHGHVRQTDDLSVLRIIPGVIMAPLVKKTPWLR